MANDLVVAERDAQAVISSPELQKLQRISLGTVNWPGQPTRMYLSGGLTLTDSERESATRLLGQITAIAKGPAGSETVKARLGLLAKMMLVYPTANASEATGQARAEAYLETLGDIAPWVIDRSIHKWHRGECGVEHNYQFAPAPATLLAVCRLALWQYERAIKHLDGLLNAIPLDRAMDSNPVEVGNVRSIVPKMQRI